jgi:putative MATE family efflux protein
MKVSIGYNEIWRISWPIMLSSLANTVINFTDVAFVARVGEKQLAASALGGVFYFVLVMIGAGIGVGIQILIARRAGELREDKISEIFDNGLTLLLSIIIAIQLLLYTCVPWLMNFIVTDTQIAGYTIEYLFARGWGLFFLMILTSLRSFYTGIAFTRIITYTTVIMMVLNIILNYILTLGNLGFEAMGIFGSGLASAISEMVAALYAVIYTFMHKRIRSYRLFNFKELNFTATKQIAMLSAPIVLQHLVSMGAWFIFFLLIEKLGSRELAVSNVVRSVYMVLMTPVWGYAQATNSMVSNIIGQGKKDQVFVLIKKIVVLSLITSIVTTSFFVLFPQLIFDLSTSDTSLIADAMGSFYVISGATIIFCISMILLSAVSGTGSTNAAMVIEMINIFVYLSYVFACSYYFKPTVEVVWFSEVVYWLLMGVFSFYYLKSNKWIKHSAKLAMKAAH